MTLPTANTMLTGEPLLLVVDLEATCWEKQISPDGEPQSVFNMEIIELGCAIATRQGDLLDSHSFLVRPIRNPTLSDFCTTLTGITQPMVDDAQTYAKTIRFLSEWLSQRGENFIWCSWGNYDLRHVAAQSEIDGTSPPMLNYSHLNLKRLWRLTTGQRKKKRVSQCTQISRS